MPTVTTSSRLAATPQAAQDMFWDLQTWRDLWTPIEQVTIVYDDPVHQEFVMDVELAGHLQQVRTIRYRRPGVIEFFSPDPPPAFTHHVGTWSFTADGEGGTVVTATRVFTVPRTAPDADLPGQLLGARLQDILARFAAATSAGVAASPLGGDR